MGGDYIDTHEHMADLAIDGAIRQEPPEFFEALVDRVQQSGGSVAMLLHLSIVRTAQRADRGELPD